MRRFAATLILILCCSCANQHFTLPTVIPLPNTSLRTDVEVFLSSVAWHHARCYYDRTILQLQDLEVTVDKCRVGLLSELSHESRLEPIKNYFEQYYPQYGDLLVKPVSAPVGATALRVALLRRTFFSKPQAPAVPTSGAPEPRISDLVDTVVKWASKRLIYSTDSRRILVDVFVKSNPKSEATFALLHANAQSEAFAAVLAGRLPGVPVPPAGQIPPLRSSLVQYVQTNQTMKEVYRGLYIYVIERSGYKTATGPLNLVDWDWNADGVVCLLVPERSIGQPLPCNLR